MQRQRRGGLIQRITTTLPPRARCACEPLAEQHLHTWYTMEAHNTHMDIKQHKHIGSQAQSNISSHHGRQASPSRISNTKYSSTRQHAALWSPHNNQHSSHSMSCSRLVDLPRRQAHRAGMEVWVDIPGHQRRCRRRPLAALARNVPSSTSFGHPYAITTIGERLARADSKVL